MILETPLTVIIKPNFLYEAIPVLFSQPVVVYGGLMLSHPNVFIIVRNHLESPVFRRGRFICVRALYAFILVTFQFLRAD